MREFNVLLFIGSLQTGGAERQALCMARAASGSDTKVHLVTVFPGGPLWDEAVASQDVSPESLFSSMPRQRWRRFLALFLVPFKLREMVRRKLPDVVYSMLYLTNLFARLSLLAYRGSPPLVWGVRSSNMEGDYRYQIPYKLGKLFSAGVSKIISNSRSAVEVLRDDGFSVENAVVVPNGIDSHRFSYSIDGRQRVRDAWDVAEHELVVGLVGRLDPMKGHPVFIRMAAHLVERDLPWRFVCVGPGPESYKRQLYKNVECCGLSDRFLFTKADVDIRDVYSAIDIVVSASVYGEGFPNVIGEAMSCERACVVSDVGDSAMVVGDCGLVVSADDDLGLANAVISMSDRFEDAGRCGRRRIESEFSVQRLLDNTVRELREVTAS